MTDRQLAALGDQGREVVRWLADLDDTDFAAPSVLPGWDVRMLAAHVVVVFEGAARALSRPTDDKPLPVAEYVKLYRPNAAAIASLTSETAGDDPPAQIVERLSTAVGALPAELPPARAVPGGRGPITPKEWIATRLVEVVVHADDLSRSLPAREPVPFVPGALAAATRTLAEILAAQVPGRTVEVRVPPYVAVQAVEGPRHTRGTPPNVVEMDPVTWVRVAGGRVAFTDAVASGAINASGLRADLTPYLPLLG